jgi:hypothetical protein
MKTSAVLNKAKKHLAKNYEDRFHPKESFICYSIKEAEDSDKVPSKDSERVRDIIRGRLSPYPTLEVWLESKHKIKRAYSVMPTQKIKEYINKIQATRHAWIDSMIAEFEAKGD